MKTLFLLTLISLSCLSVTAADAGKHLFLLSGQSNMSRFQHKQFFIPAVQAAYGADKVIIIKNAQGGQPISKWYKAWASSKGEKPKETGQLYDSLIENVKEKTAGVQIKSVTFGFSPLLEAHALYHFEMGWPPWAFLMIMTLSAPYAACTAGMKNCLC
jgi:hypothetical protein